MVESPISTYFSTKEIHKFMLFVAVVILIASLFIETKGIENLRVQKASLRFVILGLSWWLVYDLGLKGIDLILDNKNLHEDDRYHLAIFLIILWYIFLIGSIIWGLKRI